jgi:FkbM family methyltransferase
MTYVEDKMLFLKLKLALLFKRQCFLLNNKNFFFIKKSIKYLFKEIFLKKTYYFKTTNKKPLIFDCGANVGLAAVYFKSIYPESKVVAFEANEKTFNILKSNLNEYPDITVHQKALVDFEGEVKFFYNKAETADLGMSINQRYFKDYEVVPATKLSNYIDKEVDLIKLDVEGAEDLVLKDLVQSKKIRSVKQMIVEYHHQDAKNKSKIGNFINHLEENNFTCHVCTENESLFVFPRQQTFIIYAFNKDFENSLSMSAN